MTWPFTLMLLRISLRNAVIIVLESFLLGLSKQNFGTLLSKLWLWRKAN
ncbi:hypothetical protein B0I33_103426 [Prauserella shujinwangii]|uniref:Uncharacterized protein n=1 Tax=Prauserella shujinwangii TaxID=1453103 RepID=A0A2T0LZ68_9PSEU|nr:hypothetical protein B0I33_103426 [Prauserella shujinwangii]